MLKHLAYTTPLSDLFRKEKKDKKQIFYLFIFIVCFILFIKKKHQITELCIKLLENLVNIILILNLWIYKRPDCSYSTVFFPQEHK